ncbi:hypothetical protein QYS49_33115 [Marivirga salinae]|uniref:Uncharacterized protein n=1 Tax=Marivirga salinarum TaxID=3059078 RepID=A0AA51NBQ7_9BACT|nr:hypothetical protein [Marivirga sp. BDSF4-3]WMN12282.1 hypothetical protein QYS49_33115 [Marivirga sp. BDSF4-3]
MKNLYLFLLVFLVLFQLKAQNLDKLRELCIDEVNLSKYSGELSQEELQNQIAALGFRYIENGQIKYHKELIVYDCNTGNVKFTAVFDQNRLEKEFVLYESKDIIAKKIIFSKNNQSPNVDLSLNYKGQEIPAYPVGKAEIFNAGKLSQVINFKEYGSLPLVTNYNANLKKTSEGPANISGDIQGNWNIAKVGEWKNFNNGKLASISIYDKSGNEIAKKLYNNGVLIEERKNLSNGLIELSTFFANGNIKENGQLKGNTKIGSWKYFNTIGELKEQINYLNGKENLLLVFGENGNFIERTELVNDKSELTKSLQNLSSVYKYQSYYSNEKLKSEGYTSNGKKVGVFEVYDERGNLSEITEFDIEGNKINSLDAGTYQKLKIKEKQIFRELLVAKTTHPENLNLINNIRILTDSLSIDFDSLMASYNYVKDYEKKYTSLESETSSFGNLANELNWYDSLLAVSQDFNNEVWAYSHDLFETELALEKQRALNIMGAKFSSLTERHTSIKKTLFGEKIVVMNEQDEIYEFVMEELYPVMNTEISTAIDKYEVRSTVKDFSNLLKKASSIISQPDEKFQQSLQNTESVQDKKQLFLTVK